MKAAGGRQQGGAAGEREGAACLSNGVQVGKACQSFSTDVGNHVLVQGHIRCMHQVRNTTATTVLHHNPQRLTATPTALHTAPGLTSCFAHGGSWGGRAEGWGMGGVGLWYLSVDHQCLPRVDGEPSYSQTCRAPEEELVVLQAVY